MAGGSGTALIIIAAHDEAARAPARLPAPARASPAAATTRRRPQAASDRDRHADAGGHRRRAGHGLRARRAAERQGRRRSRSRRRGSTRRRPTSRPSTTNCGTFEITLDAKRAPKTGGSFKSLADEGFFDGLTFHRIVPGFVIQGGDPAGDGHRRPRLLGRRGAAAGPRLHEGRRRDGQDAARGARHVGQPVLRRHRRRRRSCRRTTRCSARSPRARTSST